MKGLNNSHKTFGMSKHVFLNYIMPMCHDQRRQKFVFCLSSFGMCLQKKKLLIMLKESMMQNPMTKLTSYLTSSDTKIHTA